MCIITEASNVEIQIQLSPLTENLRPGLVWEEMTHPEAFSESQVLQETGSLGDRQSGTVQTFDTHSAQSSF